MHFSVASTRRAELHFLRCCYFCDVSDIKSRDFSHAKKKIFIEHKHEDCHSTTMKPPSIASNQTNAGRECSSFQGIFMSLLGES